MDATGQIVGPVPLLGHLGGSSSLQSTAQQERVNLLARIRISLITENYFVIQDYPWVVTSVFSLHQHLVGQSDDPGMHAGFGFTSIFNFFFAVGGIYDQVRKFNRAKEIRDVIGQIFSGLLVGRYLSSFVSACASLPAKICTLVNLAHANTVHQVAIAVLGRIAMSCGTVLFSILTIPFAVRGFTSLYQLNKIYGDKAAAFNYLKSQLELTPNEEREFQNISSGILLPGDLTEEEKGALTREEFLREESVDLKKARALKKLSKQAAFDRSFGDEARKEIRAALREGGSISPADQDRMVSLAKKGSQYRAFINILWLGVAALAIASFVTSMVATGGGTLLAALILSMIAAVMITTLDSCDFMQELKNNNLSKEDRMIIGMINMMISICTAIASAFSAGLAPLLISSIGGTLLLLFQLFITYITRKQA